MNFFPISKLFKNRHIANRNTVNSFWYGDSLSWIERACLKSFLDHDMHVRLFVYGSVDGVPDGVEVADANTIIPEKDIFFFDGVFGEKSKGTPSVFSNLFRYKLQAMEAGPWIDCDIYCVKPFNFNKNEHVFGWQNLKSINTAVLLLPKNSPVLEDLLDLFIPPFSIPAWVGSPARKELTQKFGDGEVHPSFLPWGSVGPRALTALVKKHDLLDLAQHMEVFYPVMLKDIENMFDPEFDVFESLEPETVCIHLWNNELRHRADTQPPEGSFLHKLWMEGHD